MKKGNNFAPHFKNYGKIKQINRNESNTKLKILHFLEIALGILTTAAIFFGLYVTYLKFIVPTSTTTETIYIEEKAETNQTEVLEETDFLFIVNEENPLDEDYMFELVETQSIYVSTEISTALNQMCSAASDSGYTLVFSAGYVSPEDQDVLYEEKVLELINDGYTSIMAKFKASFYAPKAYEAENQTGFCVTIDADKDNFSNTDVYSWLVQNAAEYGFVFRYPDGKSDTTLHEDDLRVLRFVGVNEAITMRQLSMCLEEYIEYLKN
ncbi:MAG: M15 family metallopeptidase [Clostridia bacterium]